MRIGQLTYSYLPVRGGGEVYLEALFRLFARGGHSQRVYQRPTCVRAAPICQVPNPLRGLPAEFWTQALFLPLRWPELAREDLLIAHYPPYLLAAAGAARWGRRPRLVGVSHGVFWDDRPRSFRSRAKRALARAAFRLADAYVANDSFFLREMGLRLGPGEGAFSQVRPRVWYIPNCVDTQAFCPGAQDPRLAEMHPILVMRNLYRNRGIHLAIQAFARFAPAHPEATLLIVGAPAQRGYAAELRRLARSLGLASRVVFWGPAAHAEVLRFYRSAELTLVPSLCGEGTSLAALEAMACAAPTILTDVAGLKDLPGPHAPAEPEGLARVMEETWEARRQLGLQQLFHVKHQFDMTRWEQAWLRVVEQADHRMSC